MELGAGTGLPSVLLAAAGAAKVLATDLAPVLSPLSLSIHRNCPSNLNITAKEYAWGEDAGPLAGPYDVILASDIVYDFDYFPHFVKSLKALASRETEIVLGYRERYRDAEEWFFEEVKSGFEVEEISERYEPYALPKIRLFEFHKVE